MIKAKELIEYRAAAKGYKSARVAQILGSVAAVIPSAIEASNRQQMEIEARKIQQNSVNNYIAMHSSNAQIQYSQYSQNFGNTAYNTRSTQQSPRITTSNGYDTPLTSPTSNNSYSGSANTSINTNSNEQIISAVYLQGNQLVTCRLRYYSSQIWAYSTSKDALHRENWTNIYPQTPSQTISIQDGDYARDYKYKVSASGLTFYFNL